MGPWGGYTEDGCQDKSPFHTGILPFNKEISSERWFVQSHTAGKSQGHVLLPALEDVTQGLTSSSARS